MKALQRRYAEMIIANGLMVNRSRELSRMKLSQKCKAQSVVLCDAANFSDFTGFVDEALLTQVVPMLEIPSMKHLRKFYDEGSYRIDKYILSGEIVFSKIIRSKNDTTFEGSLTKLGYESKILGLIGNHDNIVEQIGISFFDDDIPVLLFKGYSEITFSDYMKSADNKINLLLADRFIDGVSRGLTHIHGKEVLHNFIHERSVYVDRNSGFGNPIIGDFSYACRSECSKLLTPAQQDRFRKYNHLPPKVHASKVIPSISSDVYSFGRLISLMQRHIQDEALSIKLCKLVKRCFDNSEELYILTRNWKYFSTIDS